MTADTTFDAIYEALAALITEVTGRPVGGRPMAEALGMTLLADKIAA